MNDNASLALGASRSGFGGLPQRLVQDGVVEEAAMLEAVNAARERKTSVVTQLVASGAANARDIAVAASTEFGVPLFDLEAEPRPLCRGSLFWDARRSTVTHTPPAGWPAPSESAEI